MECKIQGLVKVVIKLVCERAQYSNSLDRHVECKIQGLVKVVIKLVSERAQYSNSLDRHVECKIQGLVKVVIKLVSERAQYSNSLDRHANNQQEMARLYLTDNPTVCASAHQVDISRSEAISPGTAC